MPSNSPRLISLPGRSPAIELYGVGPQNTWGNDQNVLEGNPFQVGKTDIWTRSCYACTNDASPSGNIVMGIYNTSGANGNPAGQSLVVQSAQFSWSRTGSNYVVLPSVRLLANTKYFLAMLYSGTVVITLNAGVTPPAPLVWGVYFAGLTYTATLPATCPTMQLDGQDNYYGMGLYGIT